MTEPREGSEDRNLPWRHPCILSHLHSTRLSQLLPEHDHEQYRADEPICAQQKKQKSDGLSVTRMRYTVGSTLHTCLVACSSRRQARILDVLEKRCRTVTYSLQRGDVGLRMWLLGVLGVISWVAFCASFLCYGVFRRTYLVQHHSARD